MSAVTDIIERMAPGVRRVAERLLAAGVKTQGKGETVIFYMQGVRVYCRTPLQKSVPDTVTVDGCNAFYVTFWVAEDGRVQERPCDGKRHFLTGPGSGDWLPPEQAFAPPVWPDARGSPLTREKARKVFGV